MSATIPALAGCLFAILANGCGEERQPTQDEIARAQLKELLQPAEPAQSNTAVTFFTAEEISQALGDLPPDTTAMQTKYPDGSPQAQGFTCDDRPVGEWIYWHEGGQIAARGVFKYGGKEHGTWARWSRQGTRIQWGEYDEGKEHGSWWYWHDNGKPQSHGQFHQGIKVGHWIHWHDTGAKSAEGSYQLGVQSGTWRYYNSKGELVNKTSYQID
ncbi:MAG: hypothetical protein F6K62_26665 [Sphaerospermopsis sp. SIO1G2]|nr:hypothetical protein [Sphaerospermopsis sp. SIO1G2]